MTPLELVRLSRLMDRTSGRPDVAIALIDGPVAMTHPELTGQTIREVRGTQPAACARAASAACLHGTFVAGLLLAKGGEAPGICPGCTLLVRPIFSEQQGTRDPIPSATSEELAAAIVEAVAAGARVINVSAAVTAPSPSGRLAIRAALDFAARHAVVCVVAAGNDGFVGSSALTEHPWVIPVSACDRRGRPLAGANLGRSIARHGLRAPGEAVAGLGAAGSPQTLAGTSIAAPFVTGAIALLLSALPRVTGAQARLAVTRTAASPSRSVVPPLLDAWAAYESLAS